MIKKIKIIAIFLLMFFNISSAATYFVSKSGNDDANGLSWGNAWATLSRVNDGTVAGGDTVFFGTGTWRGFLKVVSGTSLDRTVYACSSFAFTNGNGDYHFAKIWGSDSLSGWTRYSGNVYSIPYTDGDVIMLAQGEHLFFQRQSLAEVNSPGEHYIGGGILYAYIHNDGYGYDPDYYDMEASCNGIIHIESNSNMVSEISSPTGSFVTLWGLEFKYGCPCLIALGEPEDRPLRNFRVEHCKLSHVTSRDFSTNNPNLIGMRRVDVSFFYQDITVLACSLGYCFNYGGSTHGVAITTYTTTRFTVDSCTFYGSFTGDACVQFKSGYDDPSVGNVVKNSIFTPTSSNIGVKLHEDQYKDSVYSNIFVDIAAVYPSFQSAAGDSLGKYFYIFNNTVINGRLITTTRSNVDVYPQEYKYIKYNLVYRTTDGDEVIKIHEEDPPHCTIDSNLYCIVDSTFRIGTVHYNLSSWENTFNEDVHSTFVGRLEEIGFYNFNMGDYSRPDVPQEIDLFYGGRRWTVYGAIQNDYNDSLSQFLTAVDTTWSTIDVENYYILIDVTVDTTVYQWSVNNFSAYVADTIVAPANPDTIQLGGLTQNTAYQIRAISWDTSVGIIDTSSTLIVRTHPIIPAPDTLGTIIEGDHALAFASAVEAGMPIFYEFELDTVGNFPNPSLVLPFSVSDTIIAVFEDLVYGVEYCWRVRAAADSILFGDWSPVVIFSFGAVAAGEECVGIYPLEGSTIDSFNPTFIASCEDANNYIYFQVDDNINFDFPVESGPVVIAANNTAEWQISQPLSNEKVFFWRAGIDNLEWSSPISFRVALDIYAYPVPFRAQEGHSSITFTNLPEQSRVTIATVSGGIVKISEIPYGGNWVWDVKNDRDNLAPGVYLYAIEFPSGTSRGKLMVIK